MNDEELRVMAGQALGLTSVEMNMFNPLFCDRQTLEIARELMLIVQIDCVTHQTAIIQIDPNGKPLQLLVEEHGLHHNNPACATRYAVLKAAAGIGMLNPIVKQPNHEVASLCKKAPNYKHGRRITKAKTQEAETA
jgi:hypothetical protein